MIKNKVKKMLKIFFKKKFIILTTFIAILPLAVCLPQQQVLKTVTFQPMWVPQPQFAGYYMAKEKGIYEKYGLDVNIIPGGYNYSVTSQLKNGKADFGVLFLYTGVMERANGTKLVNIGQIFQHSATMFVAKKNRGIKRLKDFNGKKIGVWRTVLKELTEGFLKQHKIKAQVIQFDKGLNVFLKDVVDITVMMNYNEYSKLINSGINPDEVNVFNFYDYGINFPEDGIYCMESTYKKDPDLCKKFVQASEEGWAYALANKEETINVLTKYQEISKVASNKSHNRWMLNCMTDMIKPPVKVVNEGTLLESDFISVLNFLYNNKFITTKPLYSEFYKGSR
jgi:NitT/TauT family transport system substrate-binding protein